MELKFSVQQITYYYLGNFCQTSVIILCDCNTVIVRTEDGRYSLFERELAHIHQNLCLPKYVHCPLDMGHTILIFLSSTLSIIPIEVPSNCNYRVHFTNLVIKLTLSIQEITMVIWNNKMAMLKMVRKSFKQF